MRHCKGDNKIRNGPRPHEENRSEHSKDTRATEQSYLARGLAERVNTLRRTEGQLVNCETPAFAADAAIAVMALVAIQVESDPSPTVWWLVPVAGGLKLSHQAMTIQTLTPTALLGRALLGLEVGDDSTFTTPRGVNRFEVLELA